MDTQVVLTYLAISLSVGSAVVAVVNHKRIRSNCCGRKTEISLDIGNTTPELATKINGAD